MTEGLSLAQQLAVAPPEVRNRFLSGLSEDQARALLYDPEFKLRPDQIEAVRNPVYLLVLLCGRMWGKSETASHWLAQRAMNDPGEYALVAPKEKDLWAVEIDGPSGLRTALPPGYITSHVQEKGFFGLANGSRIHYRGSDLRVGGLRGMNLKGAVVAEATAMPPSRLEELLWEHLIPAVRIGLNPQILIVCTPKPHPWLRDIVAGKIDLGGDLKVVRGRSEDNTAISAKVIRRMRSSMTVRRARQELDAEILEDIDGALWTASNIEEHRVSKDDVPRLNRIAVGMDPPVSEDGDECGIVVVGRDNQPDPHGYVLADRSAGGLTPDERCRRAIQAYLDFDADEIVVEVNNGGDWIPHALASAAKAMGVGSVPVRVVRATRGKRTRAEPISVLSEQGRMHFVGKDDLPDLEEQCTRWVPDSGQHSPDRLDAFVWAATQLFVVGGELRTFRIVEADGTVIEQIDGELWRTRPGMPPEPYAP